MVNFITIKDAAGTNKNLHTIEDSTSVHFNQSIPTDQDGNIATVVSGSQAALTGMSGLVVALHPTSPLPTGTNHLGKVSIAGQFDVSVGPVTANIADNAPVSVHGGILGAVSLGGGSALIGGVSVRGIVSVQPDGTANWPVSVANSLTVGAHAVTTLTSVLSQVNVALTSTNNNIALTSIGTNPVPIGHGTAAQALRVELPTDGTGVVGLNAGANLIGGVSVRGLVSVVFDGTNANVPVSVANTITVGAHAVTTLTSVLSQVNVALTSTNNNVALTSVGSNPVPIGTGTATQALRVVLAGANTDKVVVGAVSIADGSITVGSHAVTTLTSVLSQVNVALTSTNNNVAITSIGTAPIQTGTGTPTNAQRVILAGNNTDKLIIGAVSIADTAITLNALPAGSNLIGAVSVRGNILGAVSIQNIADVSVQDNAPVSVRGGVLGAVSLGGGSAIIGRVSIAGMVTVEPKSNTGAAVPAGAFYVGGTDSAGNLRGVLVDTDGTHKVGGFVTNAESSFTRPADSTAYASGDMVGNDTNKNSLTPLSFPVSRFSGGGGTVMIRRARIVKSTGPITNAQFRLHLYATSNGITNAGVSANVSADNAAYTASKCSAYLGFVSVVMTVSHGDGAVGWGMPNKGMEMSVVLPTAQFGIQGLMEARAAYTPGSAERFNVTLEVFQD